MPCFACFFLFLLISWFNLRDVSDWRHTWQVFLLDNECYPRFKPLHVGNMGKKLHAFLTHRETHCHLPDGRRCHQSSIVNSTPMHLQTCCVFTLAKLHGDAALRSLVRHIFGKQYGISFSLFLRIVQPIAQATDEWIEMKFSLDGGNTLEGWT